MGTLFTGLAIAANSLGALQKAMDTTSNNVSNSSTPGYAVQVPQLAPDIFDPASAVGGGVSFNGTADSRSQYAERNVRSNTSGLGDATERTQVYTRLQQLFPIDGKSGIPLALSGFFSAFSNLTTTPNDSTARQLALDAAQTAANSFNQAISALKQVKQSNQQDINDQVAQINQIGQQIATINRQFEQNASSTKDPGLNAQLATALQNLSQYADITALQQDNGTVTVTVGQSMLVSSHNVMPLQVVPAAGNFQVQDGLGHDMSTSLTSGSLAVLLDQTSNVLPATETSINQLAQSFASAVNSTLRTGVDQSNNPPAQDLFSFDPVAGAAATLRVNPLQPSDLALAGPAAPGGNAVAVQLAQLQTSPLIGGQTLTQYYGGLASQVGQNLANAESDQSTAQSLTAQAESTRNDLQSVSLDTEAIRLLQLQRTYDAISQFVKVIGEVTADLNNMMPAS